MGKDHNIVVCREVLIWW